jgi:DNA helicase-2/ATP-dependent DNA helicase PcrA
MIALSSDSRATVPLTDQQQCIVAHSFGPALVYAVAGAGKTTAMVRRVERLVREQVFAPERILLSSFNRSAVDDLGHALASWPHCRSVARCTLHALGYKIVRDAVYRGFLPTFAHDAVKTNGEEHQLLWDARDRARQRGLIASGDLDGLDEQDFLTYMSACKGNLQYPDLATVQLPPAALQIAQQAEAPPDLPWYLDLYALCEEVRRERGWLTFDDMLLLSWEALVCHPVLLSFWQHSYDAVIVDEFQDVNLAQAELLDLLTRQHRNFMAIGDDDQTIYGFRGASMRFFRSFAERYGATIYEMTDTFRCQGAQVVLANRVIAANRDRHPKALVTTKGFAGITALRRASDATAIGHHIVDDIRAAHRAGFRGAEIVVLVRLTAQTPLIEQPLIEAKIPYRVVGEEPFFRRREAALCGSGHLRRDAARRACARSARSGRFPCRVAAPLQSAQALLHPPVPPRDQSGRDPSGATVE